MCTLSGTPFKCHYWLAQCGVYLAVMLVEKLIVGPLIIFDFWNKVGDATFGKCAAMYRSMSLALLPTNLGCL